MPEYAMSGNYTLRIVGTTDTSITGILFENETKLEFEAKHVSIFIQTDKYLYNKRHWGKLVQIEKDFSLTSRLLIYNFY